MDSGIVDTELDDDEEFRRDLDSLYTLPLRILPLKSNLFRRGKMIKDARLETAIEVFSSAETGSGRIYLAEVNPDAFEELDVKEDISLLCRLGNLQSFDVYSLRICLRELDIEVDSDAYLRLSQDMKDKLKERMTAFTQPLLREVYGQTDIEAGESADIIKMFSDPDIDVALGRLRVLSSLLNIELSKIPTFLEDFSDIYLSLAYYQECVDEIGYYIDDFHEELRELQGNFQLRQDHRLMRACEVLGKTLTRFDDGVQERFDAFNDNTDKMWENISAKKFRKIEAVIRAHHTTIGGILCGVGSKMVAWRQLFPEVNSGGPVARSDALMSQIVPGLEKIISSLKVMESLDFDIGDDPA